MKRNRKHPSVPPRRQRGVATLLIVLVVGLAVSVTVAATVYSLRGTQAKQLTTHSATAAQAAAWRGVEALRLYLLQLDKAQLAGLSGPVTGMGALGVKSASVVNVAASGVDRYQVKASVTGEAGVGSALTTATVEVIYDVGPGAGGPGTPPVCHSMPSAPVVFNGNVTLGGGGTQVVDAEYDYEHILISGDLIVGGSEVKVSGCVKGNVAVTGGGLTKNGHLYSESRITVGGMNFPAGARFWAKDMVLNGGSGGPITEAKVGAYEAQVVVNGQPVGEARVGGTLIPDPAGQALPWRTGAVIPARSGKVKITLSAGKGTGSEVVFLLNLLAPGVVIDPATGQVSGISSALEQLSGPASTTLHGGFVFKSVSIFGGLFEQNSGATTNVDDVWGWDILLKNDSRTYQQVRAAGDLTVQYKNVTVKKYVGGGFIWAQSGDVRGSGFPTVVDGRTAGDRFYGAGKQLMADALQPANFSVSARQGNVSPGLPGLPYCDVRTNRIDANVYKAMANYVFDLDGEGNPIVTIQNVKSAAGVSIDGTYLLSKPPAFLETLLACGWSDGFAECKTAYNKGKWTIKPYRMPPGVLWFGSSLEFPTGGTNNNELLNSIVVNGNVSLGTQGGRLELHAPNFATPSQICDGAYWPANLCDKSGSSSKFVTWQDASGKGHVGLPIANAGVIATGWMNAAGWTIHGSVLLGSYVEVTNGNKVIIKGSLSAGNNGFTDINVGSSGVLVETPQNWNNLGQLPVCTTGTTATSVPASASVLWSRYL
ncbi:MAG: hypothetical protein J0I01_04535 [Stenotrophomonas nitritireducens]|nr:hypothetical protein [Stenotrophomonas nitritireducens]MBN8791478.1 hypothetical protein [Stenotrophomonas nitritireducens]MBN8795417.1 hypothetical protein [Stenotrophomonas nitritireducens]